MMRSAAIFAGDHQAQRVTDREKASAQGWSAYKTRSPPNSACFSRYSRQSFKANCNGVSYGERGSVRAI